MNQEATPTPRTRGSIPLYAKPPAPITPKTRPPRRPVNLAFWQALWDCLKEASRRRPPHQPPNTFTLEQSRLALVRGVVPVRADGNEGKREAVLGTALSRGAKAGYWERTEEPRTYRFLMDPAAVERERLETYLARRRAVIAAHG